MKLLKYTLIYILAYVFQVHNVNGQLMTKISGDPAMISAMAILLWTTFHDEQKFRLHCSLTPHQDCDYCIWNTMSSCSGYNFGNHEFCFVVFSWISLKQMDTAQYLSKEVFLGNILCTPPHLRLSCMQIIQFSQQSNHFEQK